MIEYFSLIDQKLFLIINSWHADWLNPIMVLFSGQLIWVPFLILVFAIAFKKLNRKSFFLFMLFLVLALIASDVTSSYVLKNIVQRLRPCRIPELKALIFSFGQKCGGRFGFVSSHAANSVCVLMFSTIALRIKSRAFHCLWLLPLLVSFSRIYLGVHYPGDILGGMFVGLMWGSLMAIIFRNQKLWGQSA